MSDVEFLRDLLAGENLVTKVRTIVSIALLLGSAYLSNFLMPNHILEALAHQYDQSDGVDDE